MRAVDTITIEQRPIAHAECALLVGVTSVAACATIVGICGQVGAGAVAAGLARRTRTATVASWQGWTRRTLSIWGTV